MQKAFLKLKKDKYFQQTLLYAALIGLIAGLIDLPTWLPMILVIWYRLKTHPKQKKG